MPDLPRTVTGDPSSDELRAMKQTQRDKEHARNSANYNRRRGSAAARGYGARWRLLRRMVLNRDPMCAHCGAAATDVDHIIPRRAGGADTFANLQSLCKACHSRKTARRDGAFGRTPIIDAGIGGGRYADL